MLLAFGLLVPLNLPFSAPPIGADGRVGWSVASTTRRAGESSLNDEHAPRSQFVITRVARRARSAGILPGDVLLSIDGASADSAALANRRASMREGDTLTLQLERHGAVHEARIRVLPETVGYMSYTI
ncbi:MAG: PDZ domain-containing protein [bacterium]